MDGVEIIKKIRTWSNMPIIVISAFKVVVIKFLTDVSSSTTNISDLFIYFDLPCR